MNWLTDPAVFNYIIMVLYGLTALRWAINQSWLHVVYWIGALMLQAAVTAGLRR